VAFIAFVALFDNPTNPTNAIDATNRLIMHRFNKITIIGVGLIGGSIGLAVKKRRLAKEVVGVFRRASTLRRAIKRGAIDRGAMDVSSGVKGSDLVIIATPVSLIPKIASEAIKNAKKGCIITDAGSTKGWIVNAVEKTASRSRCVYFVGSHPMAGSEKAGVEAAYPELLKSAACIVTRTKRTDSRALKIVSGFWEALGARVSVMSPAAHDRSVSYISHLPHVVAFSLAGSVDTADLKYAAEGFRDTTRVASSDPGLWADIFLTNRKDILASSRAFEKNLKSILAAIKNGDRPRIALLLARAKAKRDKLSYGREA